METFFLRVEFFSLFARPAFKETETSTSSSVAVASLLVSRLSLALVQVLDLLVAVMIFERVRWRLGGHRVERRGK